LTFGQKRAGVIFRESWYFGWLKKNAPDVGFKVYALPCAKACPGAGNLFPWSNLVYKNSPNKTGRVGFPLYLWVSRLGLLDTYLGILAPDLVSVFGVFLMRQAIEVVPDDYIAAARIDGCGEWGIFWRVILPAVTPALATLAIIKFMWTWNEFFWPLVVVNSPSMKTVTMGLIGFTNMYFIEYNLVTAAAVVSVLPILLIFVILQKWVVQAAVMTGLKG
jgi:putative chitobiose transport system permease protein